MISAALLMGFAGSLHCVSMCSPLAMSVTNRSPRALLTRLMYNLGRIFTYGILGLLIGSASWLIPLSKFQNLISLCLGVALLVFAITGMTQIKIPVLNSVLQKFRSIIIKTFGKVLQRKNVMSTFLLGSLNGLLPCGLTFLALTYSLTLGSAVNGFYYMLLFGLGTLPAMMGVTTLFHWATTRFNFSIKKVSTITLLLSGGLLIARVFLFHEPHATGVEHDLIDIVICTSKPL